MKDGLDTSIAGNAHIGAALLTSAGSLAFALNQNRGTVVGGRIHWSKALWLNLAINSFVVLPGVWGLRSSSSRAVRRMLGVTSAHFIARGAVEMHLVYGVYRWKMRYGISHDAAAFALLGTMLVRGHRRGELDPDRDGTAVAFAWFTMAMLLVEIVFALRFRKITNPAATGVFFADDSPQYRSIIGHTKRVVAVAYPVLAVILWRARRDFGSAPADDMAPEPATPRYAGR